MPKQLIINHLKDYADEITILFIGLINYSSFFIWITNIFNNLDKVLNLLISILSLLILWYKFKRIKNQKK